MGKVQQLMLKLSSYCPVDAAVDQMAVKFQHDSLPPMLQEGKEQEISLRDVMIEQYIMFLLVQPVHYIACYDNAGNKN